MEKAIRTPVIEALLSAALVAAIVGLAPLVAHAAAAPAAKETAMAGKAAADEQRAIDDIVGARDALDRGRVHTAMACTEQAETILLNAQQSSAYRDPGALKALETVDASLRHGSADVKNASQSLRKAEQALHAPHMTGSRGGTAGV
jgi:hypothetical protein